MIFVYDNDGTEVLLSVEAVTLLRTKAKVDTPRSCSHI